MLREFLVPHNFQHTTTSRVVGRLSLILFLALVLPSCTSNEPGGYPLKIIKWQCIERGDKINCGLTTRRMSKEAFEVEFVYEFQDKDGQRVSLCKECNKPTVLKSTPKKEELDDRDETDDKPMTAVLGPAEDESLAIYLMMIPKSFSITRYSFYFVNPNSNQRISNTVQGEISHSLRQ